MSTPNNQQEIELELSDDSTMKFVIKRHHYVKFVNTSFKQPFNAMQNLLASSVVEDDQEKLRVLLKNPANVDELAGLLLEEYKPDVEATIKKHSE